MSALLYRFNRPETFPLLSTYTTARGPVSIRVVGESDDAALTLALGRHHDDPGEITVMLGLPLIAIEGRPERLELDLSGDLTGCRVFVEAADSCGVGITYTLGGEGGSGPRTWSAKAQDPDESWGERHHGDLPGSALPLQFHRLGFALGPGCRGVDVRLTRLRVTGDVRLAGPGMA